MNPIMAKSKILIVEDDPDILELLHFNLEKEGYQTFRTENGEQAVLLAQKHSPDLVLLDLLLPGMDGLEVCRRLKRDPALQHIPIIMVTAKGEEMDRVVGLELGADDYIVKPFRQLELLARIKAQMRGKNQPEEEQITSGSLSLNSITGQLRKGNKEIDLTTTETNILSHLMRHAGRIVTHSNLAEAVWGEDYPGSTDSLKVHIRRLREKVEEEPGHPQLIVTKSGVGYLFPADSR